MTLGRGRLWRAERLKGSDAVALVLEREALPRELEELVDFRVEVPLREWRRECDALELGPAEPGA